MRDFIRSLGEGGRTVVLSSHLMGEVEQVSDRVGVIRAGTLVAEGTVEELRGRAGLRVRAQPLDEARAAARARCRTSSPSRASTARSTSPPTPASRADLNRPLVEAGIAVCELYARASSLEDVFFELTGESNRHDRRRTADPAQAGRDLDPARRSGRCWGSSSPTSSPTRSTPRRPDEVEPFLPPRSPARDRGLPVLRRRLRADARRLRARQRIRLGHAEDAVHAGPGRLQRARRQARRARPRADPFVLALFAAGLSPAS